MASVFISSIITAPAEKVWQTIRDFNALPQWHPMIAKSRIESGLASDQVGCIRAFELHDGSRIREQLLALSDFDYIVTYSILESEMGVSNYVATIQLSPITQDGTSFAEWQADFDCKEGKEEELVQMIGQDVFAAGFQALNEKFA